MKGTYDLKAILDIINLIIIISVSLMSATLYKIYKEKHLLALMSVYSLEFIFLTINNVLDIKYLYYITIFIILKVILIMNTLKKSKIKSKDIYIISFTTLMLIISLIIDNKYTLILNIVFNVQVVKIYIINIIKKYQMDLVKSKNKLNSNKKKVLYFNNIINNQCELQSNYKDELLKLNQDINKYIQTSQNALFILNTNREYIYSNDVFKSIMNIKNDNIDIFDYLKIKFKDSDKIIDCINNSDINHSKNIKAYSGKTYKLECGREVLNSERVIICILTDITESTLIQTRLRESEQRYKTLMDILQDGVMIHSMNKIKYINDKAIDIFDLEDNKHGDIDLFELIEDKMSKSNKQKLIDNMRRILIGNQNKIITKIELNNEKTIEVISTSIILNNTKLLLSIAIDISNLENAISEIEQSEKTYKLLLQTLPEGIAIIDKSTNEHIYRNKIMIDILKEIGIEKLNSIIKNYKDSNDYERFNNLYVGIGKLKEISIAIIDVDKENNFVVVIRNLDEKYKAQKMKEVLDDISSKCRFKTEFLSSVSNDIKRPIITIFESSKMLNESQHSEKYSYLETYTKLVRQNSYRLMRLSDNISEIGSLETGTFSMDIKKHDIVKIIKQLTLKSKEYTDEKGLRIKFKSNISSKIIDIDKSKIEKVILNLLSNSIKFTDKGGEISVTIQSKNDEIQIMIKDTGIGIPEDKMNLIFENFEQVDRTLSRGAEGSGIGLSLAKKLIKAHGGDIKVTSKVDVGSEFTIILKDNSHDKYLGDELENGCDFVDNDKVDIEFSDIYFNYNN